ERRGLRTIGRKRRRRRNPSCVECRQSGPHRRRWCAGTGRRCLESARRVGRRGGGAVIIEASVLDNVGLITAAGGDGGHYVNHATQQGCVETSSGGGGGGGGGFVYLAVSALTPGSFARIAVPGGAGGSVECSSP